MKPRTMILEAMEILEDHVLGTLHFDNRRHMPVKFEKVRVDVLDSTPFLQSLITDLGLDFSYTRDLLDRCEIKDLMIYFNNLQRRL